MGIISNLGVDFCDIIDINDINDIKIQSEIDFVVFVGIEAFRW